MFNFKSKKADKDLSKKIFNKKTVEKLVTRTFGANSKFVKAVFPQFLNETIRSQGDSLYNKVKVLSISNTTIKRALDIYVDCTVGDGYNLTVNANNYNKKNNQKDFLTLENRATVDAFWKWASSQYCDFYKRNSLVTLQQIWTKNLICFGESLIWMREDESSKFGFSLQTISSERFDRSLNGNNGQNKIVMNVELDLFGRPVAYYILSNLSGGGVVELKPSKTSSNFGKYLRIPASECLHTVDAIDPEQVRGYSKFTSVIESLEMFDEYMIAELVNAKTRAGKVGFFTKIGDESEINPLDFGNDVEKTSELSEDENGQVEIVEKETVIQDLKPGSYQVLPPGYDFKESSAEFPGQLKNFSVILGQKIASGIGLSYEQLFQDRKSSSYNAIRAATVSDRDRFKNFQNFFIENILTKIYLNWLKYALLNKQIKTDDERILTLDYYEKLSNHMFRGRGVTYVDPQKDISASEKAIALGISSRRREAEKVGVDINEVFDELEQERKELLKRGLIAEVNNNSEFIESE